MRLWLIAVRWKHQGWGPAPRADPYNEWIGSILAIGITPHWCMRRLAKRSVCVVRNESRKRTSYSVRLQRISIKDLMHRFASQSSFWKKIIYFWYPERNCLPSKQGALCIFWLWEGKRCYASTRFACISSPDTLRCKKLVKSSIEYLSAFSWKRRNHHSRPQKRGALPLSILVYFYTRIK